MEIKFYNNYSDARQINKDIKFRESLNGTLREESSLIKPTIKIFSEKIIRYNYCYIPDFKRYYSIKNITSIRNNIWEIEMEVDVLMSFKGDIRNLSVVVDKQELSQHGDEFIDDGSLVISNKEFTNVYQFPNGFNDNGEFILITAG